MPSDPATVDTDPRTASPQTSAAPAGSPSLPAHQVPAVPGLAGSPNFLLLWVGQALTVGADFFTSIALAWLVLDLTGSGLAVAAVLGLETGTRVLLLLFGGALVDRGRPVPVMRRAAIARFLLTGGIAALILSHRFVAWELVPAAVGLGAIGALFMPARQAALPSLIPRERLEAANGILQVTTQAAGVVGPLAAGLLVAARGTASAFVFDAAAYAVAAVAVAAIRPGTTSAGADRPEPILKAVASGLRAAWDDVPLRAVIIVIAAVNFAADGALMVGLVVLARFHWGGAGAFGLLLGSFSAGAVAGAIGAGAIKRRPGIGVTLVGVTFVMAAGVALLGFVGLPVAAVDCVAMGVSGGYLQVIGMSWVQRRIPAERMGRVMSLITLAAIGLSPVSYAIAGALVAVSPPLLFAGAGGLLLLTGLACLASRELRAA